MQALEKHDFIGALFMAYFGHGNFDEAYENVQQYTQYTGLIFGYEHDSPLCQKNTAEPPAEESNRTYIPVVRAGRRAPHIWVEESNNQALGDWLGLEYVVLINTSTDAASWLEAVGTLSKGGFPIRNEQLTNVAGSAYEDEAVVVVRPDYIVAAQVKNDEVVDPAELLQRILPLTEPAKCWPGTHR